MNQFKLKLKQQAAQRGAIVREFQQEENVPTLAIYISITGRAIKMFKVVLKLSGYVKICLYQYGYSFSP